MGEYEQKGAHCGLMVNELLCWYQNMMNVLDTNIMIKLSSEKFSAKEVSDARDLIYNLLPCDNDGPLLKSRQRKLISDGIKVQQLKEIFQMLQETDSGEIPKFVALQLEKLPPISYDCGDISGLLSFKKLEYKMEYLSACVVSSETSLKSMSVTQAALIDRMSELDSEERYGRPLSCTNCDNKKAINTEYASDDLKYTNNSESVSDDIKDTNNSESASGDLKATKNSEYISDPSMTNNSESVFDELKPEGNHETKSVSNEYICESENEDEACEATLSFNNQLSKKQGDQFSCPECVFKSSDNASLEYHMKSHHGDISRPADKANLNYDNIIDSPVPIHTGDKLVRCNICVYTCNNDVDMVIHMRTHYPYTDGTLRNHTEEKPLSCNACNNISKGARCTKHLNCNQCKYVTNNQAALDKHIKLAHVKENKFACNECVFETNVKLHLDQHKYFMHHLPKIKNKHNNTEIPSTLPHADDELITCLICCYQTSDKNLMEYHKASGICGKQFTCTKCDYITDSVLLLNQHMLSHKETKSFTCNICGAKASSASDLEDHKASHSVKSPSAGPAKDSPYACVKCDHRCPTRDLMKIHMSEHENKNVYVCGIVDCTFECSSPEALHAHENAHKNKTIYICDELDCVFECTSAEALLDHSKTHKSFAHMAKQLAQQHLDWVGPMKNGKPAKNTSNIHNVNNLGGNNLTPPINAQPGSQKRFTEGSNHDSSISAAPPRPHTAKIFATHYRPDTTVDDVKQDLETNLKRKTGKIYTVNVEKLKTKYDSYSSFLITAMCYDSRVFMDEKLWPKNTLVKWYKPPRRNNFLFGEHNSPHSWSN